MFAKQTLLSLASQEPTTHMQWAVLVLNTPSPILKACTRQFLTKSARILKEQYHRLGVLVNVVMRYIYSRTGNIASIGHKSPNTPRPLDIPPED